MSEKKYRIILQLSIFIVLIFMMSIVFVSLPIMNKKDIGITNGIWNSSIWEKNQNSLSTLDGKWEFYWKQLLNEDDFRKKVIPDDYVNIPSVWNTYKLHNKKLSGLGYATFRLHVMNAKVGKPIAMRISPLSTSYRMYINHKLVAKNGLVGTDKTSSKPEYKVKVFQYTPDHSSYDIILQVSNYTYARGGIWYSPQIGTVNEIEQLNNITWYRDVLFFGSFVFMFFFAASLYAFQPMQRNYFYFSLLCICIIVRTIIYGSYIITSWSLLSDLNFIVRSDYISLCWFGPILLMLTNNQYPNIISNKNIKRIRIITYTFSIFVLFTPIYIFTKSIYELEAVETIIFIYVLLKVYLKLINKKKDIFLLLIALIVFFFCGVHDLLLQNNNISGGSIEYIPIGFFILLICENVLIAKKYSDTVKENERSFFEIEVINQREREITLKFLKSQIKPHFIHNALNTIISISRKNPDEARDLLVEFSQYLRSCFDFEDLEKMVPLEHEMEFVYSYFAIEKARFGENLNVQYEIDDINVMIPPLILQPLVENAVIHGVRKNFQIGEIVVYIRKQEQIVWIGVMDNGVGMKDSEFEYFVQNSELNQGVGLHNINQRLNKLFGSNLVMENVLSGGTNIYMKIPIRGDLL